MAACLPATRPPSRCSWTTSRNSGARYGQPMPSCATGCTRSVFLSSDALAGAFDSLPVATLGPRDGGDWVPRQEWLRRDGAFASLPGGPLLGIGYENLLGDLVIKGIPPAMRPAKVHPALFSGWLRHAATTTAWSIGEATLTTFRVREQADSSLLARVLGRALVAHGARD